MKLKDISIIIGLLCFSLFFVLIEGAKQKKINKELREKIKSNELVLAEHFSTLQKCGCYNYNK